MMKLEKEKLKEKDTAQINVIREEQIKNLNAEKENILKKVIATIILIVIALISIFILSKVASSPEFHAKTIQALDKKKITVTELTAATAGTATAIALIPSDATTPLANQILGLSSYLLIIIGAIFLEKMLLTLTGYVTFTFLIPIACLLYGIYLYAKNDILKNLAIKLGVFGIVIFMVVPISVQASNLIEATYEKSINQTIEEAKNTEIETKENASKENEESGGWSGFTAKAKEVISNIGDNVSELIHKGEKVLSNFIDAIAILIITSCVIPIAVLIFFIWIIKIIFGINIPVKEIKNTKLNKIKFEERKNE